MKEQSEKRGVTADQFEASVGVRPGRLSGGQFENFRQGWAIHIMPGMDRAHYFKRAGFDMARAACGVEKSIRWLYGGGNYQRCKRCEKIARGKEGAA